MNDEMRKAPPTRFCELVGEWLGKQDSEDEGGERDE